MCTFSLQYCVGKSCKTHQSLYDYRDTANEIQQIIFTGESKNSDWENEVGYPAEEFIDDCFVDIQERIM